MGWLPFSFDADGALIVRLAEGAEKGAEVIACDTGEGAGFFFGDFDVADDIHRGFEIGGGVVAAGHVIEVCEEADIRVMGGTDDGGGFTDMVDEVAFFGAELLDGDNDVLGFGEWAEEFEEGDKLFSRFFLGPVDWDFAGTGAAEDDELSIRLFQATESGVCPFQDEFVVRIWSDAMQVSRADEAVAREDGQGRCGEFLEIFLKNIVGLIWDEEVADAGGEKFRTCGFERCGLVERGGDAHGGEEFPIFLSRAGS